MDHLSLESDGHSGASLASGEAQPASPGTRASVRKLSPNTGVREREKVGMFDADFVVSQISQGLGC